MKKSLRDRIAAHPFFYHAGPQHVDAIANCAMESQFAAGELIFKEGDPANRFYLIESGKVLLSQGNPARNGPPIPIQELDAGDVLGWSWLFPPYVWHLNARAIEPTEAIFIYGSRLREMCEADPTLGYALMKSASHIVIQRLQSTRRELAKCRTRVQFLEQITPQAREATPE